VNPPNIREIPKPDFTRLLDTRRILALVSPGCKIAHVELPTTTTGTVPSTQNSMSTEYRYHLSLGERAAENVT